jgi:hypothetical protein
MSETGASLRLRKAWTRGPKVLRIRRRESIGKVWAWSSTRSSSQLNFAKASAIFV